MILIKVTKAINSRAVSYFLFIFGCLINSYDAVGGSRIMPLSL